MEKRRPTPRGSRGPCPFFGEALVVIAMAKIIQRLTVLCWAATLTAALFYRQTSSGLLLSLAITFGTTSYHLTMRLAVGGLANLTLKNQVDYHLAWFRPRAFEGPLYEALRVKKWKGKLPSYNPSLFSLQAHSLEEIAQAMCQAELVHEAIVLLSFLPLTMTPVFGAMPVFLLTSLAAACFDTLFVLMQRYNRPRILALLERRQARTAHRTLNRRTLQ